MKGESAMQGVVRRWQYRTPMWAIALFIVRARIGNARRSTILSDRAAKSALETQKLLEVSASYPIPRALLVEILMYRRRPVSRRWCGKIPTFARSGTVVRCVRIRGGLQCMLDTGAPAVEEGARGIRL